MAPTPTPPPRSTPEAAASAAPSSKAFADILAAALVDELGPMAQSIVRRAAERGDDDEAALLMRVADDALPASRRDAFIERMRVVLAARPQPAGRTPMGAALPALDGPIDPALLKPQLLHDAQQLAAHYAGPMAPRLVRRAAAGATTREQFITRLADSATEGRDRDQLFAALCRLL